MKKLLFSLLFCVPNVWANPVRELTLYFIPSPKGIDWATPSSLATSALKNKMSFKPHFMGHVWVELKCDNEENLTGMTGKNFDYINQVLIEQRGLGVLYHSFTGQLEEKADVEKERAEYLKNGGMNFVRFLLNEGQCKRASQYLSEYRKNNIGRYYGLANRPRFGEGAGCSAFATSFPDVLNIIDQDMKEAWSQTVNVPLELAGPPVKDETVSVFKILFNATSWANDVDPHKKLTFWSPDRMYQWVDKKLATTNTNYSAEKIENVTGVVVDKSHFPVPQEPIWLQQLDPKNPRKTVTSGLDTYQRPEKEK